jgi:hypothetical protein
MSKLRNERGDPVSELFFRDHLLRLTAVPSGSFSNTYSIDIPKTCIIAQQRPEQRGHVSNRENNSCEACSGELVDDYCDNRKIAEREKGFLDRHGERVKRDPRSARQNYRRHPRWSIHAMAAWYLAGMSRGRMADGPRGFK